MSRLRLAFTALLLASSLASACSATQTTAGHVPRSPAISDPAPVDRPAHPAQPAPIDRAALRAKLAERRQVVVERFLAYRERRVYPVNNVGPGFRHVWRDDHGNLCAAATLISQDWGYDAAARVGAQDNQLALATVKDGPLADWILTSGLTHHEIVAIQVPGFEVEVDERSREIERLYAIYVDVERQLRTLGDANLDAATDALLRHPALARQLLDGQIAGPGPFSTPAREG